MFVVFFITSYREDSGIREKEYVLFALRIGRSHRLPNHYKSRVCQSIFSISFSLPYAYDICDLLLNYDLS